MDHFANRAFNLVYVHAGLQSFATYGGEVFAFVYLLHAGIPAPVVLTCIAAMFGCRIVFRQFVLPVARRIGLRWTLVGAVLAEASAYPILSQVTEVGPLLFGYLTLWAISSSFYWTTYHAYVSLMGDNHRRGAQSSTVELVTTGIGVVAPALTAGLLTVFGPEVAFGTVAVLMALSAVPVAIGPDLAVPDRADMPPNTRAQARLLMFTDGLRSGAFHFTWTIALFLTLGGSFVAYGGAMALAGVAGAIAALFVGRMVDLGSGLHAVRIGFAVLTTAALARVLGYPVPVLAVAANALAALAWPVFATAFNARIYTLARQSPCPLRFHIVAEGGWDIGCCAACLTAAALIHIGFGFHLPLAVALVGCALGYWATVRTFTQAGQASAAPPMSGP
jgi:MFS transporter, DHA1 family, inner membrane transport protein